jgi:hypothetical protein
MVSVALLLQVLIAFSGNTAVAEVEMLKRYQDRIDHIDHIDLSVPHGELRNISI